MTTKTSAELKGEVVGLYYGINPKTLLVERVSVSRGGSLTLQRMGRPDSVYRIKGGRPAYGEINRVFGLTDLVAVPFDGEPALADGLHPSIVALNLAADERRGREQTMEEERAGG